MAGKRGVCNGKHRSDEGRAEGTNVEIRLGFSGKTGAAQRHRHEQLVEEGEAQPSEGTDAIEN